MMLRELFLAFLVIFWGMTCYTFNPTVQTRIHHNNLPSRTIRVAIGPNVTGNPGAFDQHHVDLIEKALVGLEELNIHVVIVPYTGRNTESTPTISQHTDVTIWWWANYPVNDSGISEDHCSDSRIGLYTWETNYVLIDPGCARSDNQFQVIVLHEVSHWLGMHHICRQDGRTTDTCSDVGRGLAVLNPFIDENQSQHFTDLDIKEYLKTLRH